jgi:hypothetical protein
VVFQKEETVSVTNVSIEATLNSFFCFIEAEALFTRETD